MYLISLDRYPGPTNLQMDSTIWTGFSTPQSKRSPPRWSTSSTYSCRASTGATHACGALLCFSCPPSRTPYPTRFRSSSPIPSPLHPLSNPPNTRILLAHSACRYVTNFLLDSTFGLFFIYVALRLLVYVANETRLPSLFATLLRRLHVPQPWVSAVPGAEGVREFRCNTIYEYIVREI